MNEEEASPVVPVPVPVPVPVVGSSSTSSTGVDNGGGNGSRSDARYYACNEEDLLALQQEKPWMKSPQYFESVALSPSAVMKMMMHCASGVEKGIKAGGNPIEVMGLLLGRPDPSSPKTLIVTDAFPLPIEGFETRVIADDQAVVNHMISLSNCLERSRNEKFMGWYHSHPFDVGDHSHCFLSQTDLSTQLQWQRAEDPHGNPFVAVVLDPLRSTHLGLPELKAFRAFPPEYSSPTLNECPDGSIQPSEQLRLEQWGSCWNRYYELSVEYYMSTTSRQVLEQLTQNYLWMTTFKRNESKETLGQLQAVTASWNTQAGGSSGGGNGGGGNGTGGGTAMAMDHHPPSQPHSSISSNTTLLFQQDRMQPAVQKLTKVATQELSQKTLRQVQQQVFKK
jgi:COP9 signalosome complex subunit 5